MASSGEVAKKMDKEENVNNGDDVHDIENDGSLDGNDEQIGRYWSQFSERNMTYEEPLLVKRINTTSQIAIVGSNLCPIESLDYETGGPGRGFRYSNMWYLNGYLLFLLD